MENKAHAITVGLFIILLSFMLLVSFWWLSGSRETLSEYTIISNMPVTGLSAESTVKFRGVDVGKVTRITLDPKSKIRILVDIEVPQSLQLSKESYAELKMQGVTGLAFIDLNDLSVTAPKLNAGDYIAMQASMLDKLIEKGPMLVSQIETLLQTSNRALATSNQFISKLNGDDINKSLANIAQASQQLMPLINNANQALSQVSSIASDKNQTQLLQTLSSVQKTADSFQPLMTELDGTAKEYRALARDLKADSSHLLSTLENETLPKIHYLTNNVNHGVNQMGKVLELLEENPQSLIFGNPEIKPGPGEDGFTEQP